jgi:hypothetical protein
MARPASAITSTFPSVTGVRSTLLLASRTSLTALGRFDQYAAHLPESTRSRLNELIAGTWLPVEVAAEHWAACDALGLNPDDQMALGRTNGERLRGTLLGTLARMARGAGTTPLTLVEQFPRFWGRIFQGGGMTYSVRGPKDVVVTASADPILRSPHFRNGLAGTASSILSLVCTRLFVRVTAYDAATATGAYLMQWA